MIAGLYPAIVLQWFAFSPLPVFFTGKGKFRQELLVKNTNNGEEQALDIIEENKGLHLELPHHESTSLHLFDINHLLEC